MPRTLYMPAAIALILASAVVFGGCGEMNTIVVNISASSTTVVTEQAVDLSCSASGGSGTGSTTYSYSWSATGGNFSSGTGNTTVWTAPPTPGIYAISVSVSTNAGDSGSASISINVISGTGEYPSIIGLSADPPSGSAGFTSTISCEATDPYSLPLTYAWTAEAGTLTSKVGTSVQWIAPAEAGTYPVTVSVSNPYNTSNATIEMIVTGAATAITINTLKADPAKVPAGDSSVLECGATSATGLPLTYNWTVEAGTLSSGIGQTVTWFSPSAEGTYKAFVAVSDGSNTVHDSLNVVVSKPVLAPVIASVTAMPSTVAVDIQSTITCTASDPNDPALPLTYVWSATGGSFAGSGNSVQWSSSVAGSYTITVQVSNGSRSTTSSPIYVNVTL